MQGEGARGDQMTHSRVGCIEQQATAEPDDNGTLINLQCFQGDRQCFGC
jgi:hypothetical protein